MTSNGCTAKPRIPTLVRLPALALASLLALILLPAGDLLAPPDARAATVVSNMSESENATSMRVGKNLVGHVIKVVDLRKHATSFTTGPAAVGHTLNSITTKFANKVGSPAGFKAGIFTDSAGSPGSEVVTLSGNAPDTRGDYTYTCSGSGCDLKGSTTYWLVFAAPDGADGTNHYAWRNTTSDAQTQTPANNGWSIGNDDKYQRTPPQWYSDNSMGSGLFSVDATEIVALTVDAVTGTTARLTISGHTDEWWYKHASGTCSSKVSAGNSTANVSTLTPGTEYTFTAYSDSCVTELATAAAFTTPTAPPAPSKPGVDYDDQSVTLSWTSGGDGGSAITKWQYAISADNFITWKDLTTSGTNPITATVSGLTNGTPYIFKVRAVNAVGNGAASPASDVVTPAAAKLTATNVKAKSATLTLTGHTGDWWYIKKKPTPEGPCTKASGTTMNLTNLTPSTTYEYSGYSASGCPTTLTIEGADEAFTTAAVSAPPAPTKPGVTAGAASAALSWASSGDGGSAITKWQYAESTDNYGSWTDICTTTNDSNCPSKIGYTVSGLTNGTAYKFKVRAVNAIGNGAASPESDSITPATTPPAPTKPGMTAENQSAALSWTSGGDGGSAITKWQYVKKEGSSPFETTWKDLTVQGTGPITATVSGLTNGTKYKFKIRAVNAKGDGAASPESNEGTPAATRSLTSGAVNITSATLTISGQPGDWWYSQDLPTTTNPLCVKVVSPATTATLTTLKPSTSYRFIAYSSPSCNSSELIPGATANFTTKAPTAPPAPGKPGATSGNQSVELSWTSGGDGGSAITKWQYVKKEGNSPFETTWKDLTTNGTNPIAATVSGLTNGTAYKFKVRAVNAIGDGAASPESGLITPATTPPAPGKPGVTAGSQSVALSWTSGGDGGSAITKWQYVKKEGNNPFEATWKGLTTSGTGPITATVSGLTNGTAYKFKVRAVNAKGDGAASPESDGVTPSDETLTVSGITKNGATLTIGNHLGGWWYKHASGTCSVEQTGKAASVTNLAANTSYAFTAYSDSCATAVATAAAFTTLPPKPATPTAASGAGSGKLILASSVTGNADLSRWEYKKKEAGGNFDQDWTGVAATSRTLNHVVSGLTDGTDYVFKVRAVNASGDGEESDESVAAAPADETLTVSNVTKNGATLTIGNYPGNWHYKHASGTCSTEQTGTTASVTNLAANTSYTFTAYSDSCATAVATAVAFPTLPPKPAKPTAMPGAGNGKLTLASSVTGNADLRRWEYKKKPENGNFDPDWTGVDATSRTLNHVVSGLTDGTDYVFKVRAVNASGDGEESDESASVMPVASTLTANSIEAATATLTIANHAGDWWYRYVSPAGGACSSKIDIGTLTASLVNLTPGTDYAFKAYGDKDCLVELASAPPFLTKPGKTTGVVIVAALNEQLRVSWTDVRSATSYKVQWKSGNESWDATSRQAGATGAEHTITGLTNATEYTLRVAAVNATGDGAWSNEAGGAPEAGPTTTAPLAPSMPGVAAGDARVALSWTPGGDGGSAITKWQYVRKEGGKPFETIWRDVPDSGASTRSHTVTGLTNGVAYRFKVRAVNAVGAGAASPESAAATPAAPAAPPTGWLARFGRAAGSGAVEMITGRMNAPAPEGAKMTIGGHGVDLNEDIERLLAKQGGASGGLARRGTAGGPGYRETTVSELLRGGSFHLASAKEAEAVPGGRWSMWGRGAQTSFEGGGAQGDVTTAMLGMDYEKDGVLLGVALSHARGKGGFGSAGRSGVEAKLVSAHPYLRFALNERISVWGVLGMGRGEMTLEEKGRKIETDLETRMGAFGVRGELAKVGGFDLALKSDALLAQTDADAAGGLAAVSAEATRLRLMLEASREVAMENGGAFTPSVEAGLRHDGGDADEGVGVEVGGSLHFANPAWGLTLELRARGLITHEGEDAADWGAGGMIRIDPGEAGRGLALTVEPAVGETAGGAGRLWGVEDASRLAREEAGDTDPRVRAEVGYGLAAWGGLLTPYAGLSASEDGGAYRLGGRFRVGERLSMSVEGGVRERQDDDPVHGVALRGSLRW